MRDNYHSVTGNTGKSDAFGSQRYIDFEKECLTGMPKLWHLTVVVRNLALNNPTRLPQNWTTSPPNLMASILGSKPAGSLTRSLPNTHR